MDAQFIVDTETLSELLGIGPRRIQQLAEEGKLSRITNENGQITRGTWYAPRAIKEFVQFKVETARGGGEDPVDAETRQEKLNKLRAEAALKTNFLEREEAKLFHRDDVMTVLGDCMIQIRQKLLAIPSRLTLQLLGQKDAAAVNELLTESVTEVLTSLKTYRPSDFRSPDLPAQVARIEALEESEANATE
jgi:hypothetical protein